MNNLGAGFFFQEYCLKHMHCNKTQFPLKGLFLFIYLFIYFLFNLSIIDDKNTIRNAFISTNVTLKIVSATFLLVCLVCLKDSIRETRKNVFYFTSKAIFVLEIIKF